ncbi:MAG: methyltransferase, partial [Thermodesulfobacteriota bacterium]
MERDQSIENVTPTRISEVLFGGWQGAKVLMTSVKLGVYAALADGAKNVEEMAHRLGTDPYSTELLLNALVGLGFLKKEGDSYCNTRLADKFLIQGKEPYLGFWVSNVDALWGYWSKLEQRIRTGEPVTAIYEDEEWVRTHILAIHHISLEGAVTLAEIIPLKDAKKLLDLGGGAGTYSISFCRANPNLEAVLFDRPIVLRTVTREVISDAGMDKKISLREGDFMKDDIGDGYDAVFASNIIHGKSENENRALMQKLHASLNKKGKVIIQDIIMENDRTGPLAGTLWAITFNLLIKGGRTYSFSEVKGWLTEVGLLDITR